MRAVLVLVSALLVACDFLPPAQTGSCDDPSDCSSAERCTIPVGQDLGVCTTTATENPLSLALEVSPLPGSGLLRATLPIGPQASPLADLGAVTLESSAEVQGRVVIFGSEERPSILVRAIPTESPVVGAREFFEGACDNEGFFTLSLRPGSYDIVVIPLDNTSLPPTLLRNVTLPKPNETDLVIALQNNRFLQGRILSQLLGVAGLRVSASAFDPETNLGSPDLRSSIAETAKDGGFVLSLPQDVTTFLLSVEPLAAGPNALLPSFQYLLDVSTLPVDELGVMQLSPVDLGALEAPAVVLGTVTGPGVSSGADLVPAPVGTVLRFDRIEPEGSERRFSRRVVVDEEGIFQTLLLPGSYHIEVTSTVDSAFASQTLEDVSLSCQQLACEPLSLSLARRNRFFGQIFNLAGDVITESFRIEAHPTGRPEETTQSVTSDESGRGYEIFLDPAVYDLGVVPASTASLAAWFAFGLNAAAGDTRLDLVVAPASLLEGTVQDEAGVAIVGASIRIFARDTEGRSWLLASATTDVAGRFLLVIPNPQGTELPRGPLASTP